jgi:ubiquinone/menaquinone biosynthesis C-methylase UbiE
VPDAPLYPDKEVTRLEMLWGAGFMSPGGAAEVAHLLGSWSVAGCDVLDVGSGAGGIDLLLLVDHGAARVTGIDVQADLVELSRARAQEAGLADRVDYRLVASGPLPFPGESFDAVLSKDSIVHVQDKAAMYAEMFRVLRPGGRLFVSDWLRGAGPQHDAALAEFEAFTLITLEEIARLAANAGFVDLETEDRNRWYAPLAARELERFRGDLGTSISQQLGPAEVADSLEFWEALVPAVTAGALRPGHLRARKP